MPCPVDQLRRLLCDQEDSKVDGVSADAERTDETVVDVESNSDINNMDISRASSTHTGQKIETRRRVRSNTQPSNRGSVTLSLSTYPYV